MIIKILKIISLILIFTIFAIIYASLWTYFFGDPLETILFWKIVYIISCCVFGAILGYVTAHISIKIGL